MRITTKQPLLISILCLFALGICTESVFAKRKKRKACKFVLDVAEGLAPSTFGRISLLTDRLSLESRPIEVRDAYDFVNDPVIQNSYYAAMLDQGSVDKILEQLLEVLELSWRDVGGGEFELELPIFDHQQNVFVGIINASFSTSSEGMSIGIAFLEPYRGKGFGVEAIRSFVGYVKSNFPSIAALRAAILEENLSSRKLFQKMNFHDTGLRDQKGLMLFERALR